MPSTSNTSQCYSLPSSQCMGEVMEKISTRPVIPMSEMILVDDEVTTPKHKGKGQFCFYPHCPKAKQMHRMAPGFKNIARTLDYKCISVKEQLVGAEKMTTSPLRMLPQICHFANLSLTVTKMFCIIMKNMEDTLYCENHDIMHLFCIFCCHFNIHSWCKCVNKNLKGTKNTIT